MKPILLIVCCLLFTSAFSQFRIIELSGKGYDRGKQHGQQLKTEIHELVAAWKKDVERRYRMPADSFIHNFIGKTGYLATIRKTTPDLLDEVKGIAEGCGIDFNTMYVFQLVDEDWAAGKWIDMHHCTSIGVVTGKDESIAAQNLDIPRYYHKYPTVLRIMKDKKTFSYVLTVPGLIALTGMNRNGVSINCNTLLQLQFSTDGLPVAFIVRTVLEKNNYKEASAFINSIQHASGQNYLLGGTGQLATFECSAKDVKQYKPFENAQFTYHTNHPLVNNNYADNYLESCKRLNRNPQEGLYTCQRFVSLQQRFSSPNSPVNLESIKQALLSKDDSRDPINNAGTYSTVIYINKAGKPECYMTAGSPSTNELVKLSF